MYEGRFAHHARRGGKSSRDPHVNPVQPGIGSFQNISRRLLAGFYAWLKFPEGLTDRSDGVFAGRGAGHIAALEFIRVDVADQPAQGREMFAAGCGLIVLVKRWSHESVNSKW